jgi:hypothetical protein
MALNTKHFSPKLKFLKNLWGLGTEVEKGYCTGPPDYIGWWKMALKY